MKKTLGQLLFAGALITGIPAQSNAEYEQTKISSLPGNQLYPDISNGSITWFNIIQSNQSGVYLWDTQQGERKISSEESTLRYQSSPKISDGTVVWHDTRNSPLSRGAIYQWDSSNGEQIVDEGIGSYSSPDISNGSIAYIKTLGRPTGSVPNNHLMLWNQTTGASIIDSGVLSFPSSIAISNGNIAYIKETADRNRELFLWDESNGSRKVADIHIDTLVPNTGISLYNDTIVWSDVRNYRQTGSDIYRWDPINGEQVISNSDADQEFPALYDERVVWQDNRSGDWDLYMYDPLHGEQPLVVKPYTQAKPHIYENTVVWHDNRDGNYSIYMTTIPEPSSLEIATITALTSLGLSQLRKNK